MELSDEFTVNVPIGPAWDVLTDINRIAPCMPGATLDEVHGDEFRGTMKVKVGPVVAEYKGRATFLERDPIAGRAVLRAERSEVRGQGSANAIITAQACARGRGDPRLGGDRSRGNGRVAQFGRGVLSDVSTRLIDQFVGSLETTVLASFPGASPA